jgi:LCP family protein required for cell wall assembly
MSDPSSERAGFNSADPSDVAQTVGRPERLRRTLMIVITSLVVVLTMVGIAGALLIHRYDDAVRRGNLLAPGARQPNSSASGPLNLLLIGSDFRSWNPDAGQRSDTIILAHVPRTMDRAYLISVPRDLLVDIPPMPSLNFGGDTPKINAAFQYGRGGIGGAGLVSATLTHLVGIRFDGAAVIDFSGLRNAVDILEGVRLCLDDRVVSTSTGKVFDPGCQLMQSADVLDYLRQRDFPDGDYARQRHQQQFLKAFLDRARSRGAAANPVKMDALIRAVAATMTVDTGQTALSDLVFALRDLSPAGIIGIKIPSYPDTIEDVSYVVASQEAPSLFDAVRSDSVERWAHNNEQWVNKI